MVYRLLKLNSPGLNCYDNNNLKAASNLGFSLSASLGQYKRLSYDSNRNLEFRKVCFQKGSTKSTRSDAHDVMDMT